VAQISGWTAAAAGAVALLCGAASARADDGVPFYGYSGYFGRPTTYYTRDPDVQQVTVPRGGDFGFGVRTYTTGGPFWRYKPVYARGFERRRRYHRHVLRVRG